MKRASIPLNKARVVFTLPIKDKLEIIKKMNLKMVTPPMFEGDTLWYNDKGSVFRMKPHALQILSFQTEEEIEEEKKEVEIQETMKVLEPLPWYQLLWIGFKLIFSYDVSREDLSRYSQQARRKRKRSFLRR